MKQRYNTVTQKGNNPDYPKEAYIWTLSEEVPEWISDRAKISGFKETGEPILMIRRKSSGGLELLDSSGKETLISLKTEDSWVLFSSSHPLISLTPHQLELLYDIHFRN